MTTSEKAKSELAVRIQYHDLKINVEGTYENVWKAVNDFFKKIIETFPSESSILSIKGKDVPEILLQLRNQNYFDTPRTSMETYIKLKELGKTNRTQKAISMALKKLTTEGDLKRFKKNRAYLYCAPYVDTNHDQEWGAWKFYENELYWDHP